MLEISLFWTVSTAESFCEKYLSAICTWGFFRSAFSATSRQASRERWLFSTLRKEPDPSRTISTVWLKWFASPRPLALAVSCAFLRILSNFWYVLYPIAVQRSLALQNALPLSATCLIRSKSDTNGCISSFTFIPTQMYTNFVTLSSYSVFFYKAAWSLRSDCVLAAVSDGLTDWPSRAIFARLSMFFFEFFKFFSQRSHFLVIHHAFPLVIIS